MTRRLLLDRLRSHPYAVQSSVSVDGRPQSAVVGVAVSDELEIVFDTVESSRKAVNLTRDPRIAFVFGSMLPDASWGIQVEGLADQPTGAERDRLAALYLSVFPDGAERQRWSGITYFRVRPTWIRSSDYAPDPPEILEFDRQALQLL